MTDEQQIRVEVAKLGVQVENIAKSVDRIDKRLDEHYVSQKEFKPVKTIVYTAVSMILVAVMGGLISLVVRNG